jgi:hypothetical protein
MHKLVIIKVVMQVSAHNLLERSSKPRYWHGAQGVWHEKREDFDSCREALAPTSTAGPDVSPAGVEASVSASEASSSLEESFRAISVNIDRPHYIYVFVNQEFGLTNTFQEFVAHLLYIG